MRGMEREFVYFVGIDLTKYTWGSPCIKGADLKGTARDL